MTEQKSNRPDERRPDKMKWLMMIVWGAAGVAAIALLIAGGLGLPAAQAPAEHGDPLQTVEHVAVVDEIDESTATGSIEDEADVTAETSDVTVQAQGSSVTDARPQSSASTSSEPTPATSASEPQRSTEQSSPVGNQSRVSDNVGTARADRLMVSDPSLPAVALDDMAWPVSGRIIRPFGWHRYPALGEWSYMPGVTMQPHVNEPDVRAALGGRVQDVINTGGLWRLTIAHAGGLVTQYDGLSDVRVRSFELVNTGDLIGNADPAGVSGVQFTVLVGGEPIDPTDYLGDR